MKRLVILLFLLIGISAEAQIYTYRASEFAIKTKNYNGYWTEWSEWYPSNVKITIDFNADIITIYSSKVQTYIILKYIEEYNDSNLGSNIKYQVIDQDRDIGTIRFRKQHDGVAQLYVQFSDIMWVYSSIVKI